MWCRVLWELVPGRARQNRDVPTWCSLVPSGGSRENRPWAAVGVRSVLGSGCSDDGIDRIFRWKE